MTISEKVAYLKGLAEGLDLDTTKSKEGKLISVMIGIMEELAMSVEDLEENALNLGEEIDVLSDDLADVEEVVFDEDDDAEDYDDDWFEVECPTCGADILVDDDALVDGEVECPIFNYFLLNYAGLLLTLKRKDQGYSIVIELLSNRPACYRHYRLQLSFENSHKVYFSYHLVL